VLVNVFRFATFCIALTKLLRRKQVRRVKNIVTLYCTAVVPINKTSPTQMLVIESPLKLLACNITLHGRSILRPITGYRTARRRIMKGQGAARSASEDIESVIYYANIPPRLGKLLCQFPYNGPRYSFRLNRMALTFDVLVQGEVRPLAVILLTWRIR
jgi:hypothetical protein